VDTMNNIDGLKEYLHNFLIPVPEKKEIMSKIFGEDLSQISMNFLFIMIEKKREAYLDMVYKEYQLMADESRNIKQAEVYTAREVPEEDIAQITENLSRATGKTIRLQLKVDPDLIGGVRIRIGDRIIDGTVKKKLQLLKEKLKHAKIS
ncbi:MAG: ATP synthase F1 subunit delta, partial [Eubacteriales bacterium]|nr:ATP synthase F1 subunit delta [Eubacteriales bacterium]